VRDAAVIFCVNSGRVGSKHLAKLIDTSREAHGLHEADPAMNGPFLRMVEVAHESESFDQRLIKVRAIDDWMRRHPKKPVYCETNHLFIITFHDVAAANFPRMKVIFLRRALPLVVKSFIELGYPDRNLKWRDWHISPSAATAAIPPLAPDDELDPFDRVIAHLIDVEARGERFRASHPEIPTFDVRIDELGAQEGVDRLFTGLGLSSTAETAQAIGTRGINTKAKWKSRLGVSVSVDECRRRIDRYLVRAAHLGIEVPAGLALD
jgi:hypothetical protein